MLVYKTPHGYGGPERTLYYTSRHIKHGYHKYRQKVVKYSNIENCRLK